MAQPPGRGPCPWLRTGRGWTQGPGPHQPRLPWAAGGPLCAACFPQQQDSGVGLCPAALRGHAPALCRGGPCAERPRTPSSHPTPGRLHRTLPWSREGHGLWWRAPKVMLREVVPSTPGAGPLGQAIAHSQREALRWLPAAGGSGLAQPPLVCLLAFSSRGDTEPLPGPDPAACPPSGSVLLPETTRGQQGRAEGASPLWHPQATPPGPLGPFSGLRGPRWVEGLEAGLCATPCAGEGPGDQGPGAAGVWGRGLCRGSTAGLQGRSGLPAACQPHWPDCLSSRLL